MTDDPSKRNREDLVVGDRAGDLTPGEAADVPLLAALLADPSTWAEPSPGLEDAVVRAVAGADPGAGPTAAPTELEARRAAVARRRWAAVAAAAAAVVVVAAGAVAVGWGGADGADYQGELAATEFAPGAGGSADVVATDAGFRITLDADDLPALGSGEYYQAWLKDDDGRLVPIGSFSSGDEQVTLWSGASPSRFSTLTVTIEAADGDQASSGHVVLSGELRAGGG